MAQKERCSHKGCIQHARLTLKLHNSRNQLGKKHLCCGRCCPKANATHVVKK